MGLSKSAITLDIKKGLIRISFDKKQKAEEFCKIFKGFDLQLEPDLNDTKKYVVFLKNKEENLAIMAAMPTLQRLLQEKKAVEFELRQYYSLSLSSTKQELHTKLNLLNSLIKFCCNSLPKMKENQTFQDALLSGELPEEMQKKLAKLNPIWIQKTLNLDKKTLTNKLIFPQINL